MKLYDILSIGADRFPDNQAVIHGDKQITYIELFQKVEQVAVYLSAQKFTAGSRLAILYENSIEYLICYFAAAKANLVIVPIDNSLKPAKINQLLKDCGAEVLVFQSKYLRHLPEIIDGNKALNEIIANKDIGNQAVNCQLTTLDQILMQELDGTKPAESTTKESFEELLDRSTAFSDDLAAIFYTSGSTGDSKGVMLSDRNLCSNTLATINYLELTARDRIMVILPFYYIYGNSLLLTHILTGSTLVIDNRFLYPEVILDTMEKEKVTGLSGVPSNFIILLNKSTFDRRKLPDLRYLTQAGGSMAPEIVKQLMRNCPGKKIYIMYGQTEAAPRVTWLPPDKLKEKIGSIGIPVPGVDVKIIEDNGVELPSGQSGELITRGDNVMLGYWNQPEETAETVKEGWLYTGDLARKDDDGYIFITGRKKEIIKVGGNRVSAKEIEETLLEHEKIIEAAVIGIPNDILGEAVKAYVVLTDENDLADKDIQNYCRAKLAEHKIPTVVEFMKALPKMQSGKVDKIKLNEMSQ